MSGPSCYGPLSVSCRPGHRLWSARRLESGASPKTEFTAEPVLVYDPLAGLGMWLVKPDVSEAPAGGRIEIRPQLGTGVVTVVIK